MNEAEKAVAEILTGVNFWPEKRTDNEVCAITESTKAVQRAIDNSTRALKAENEKLETRISIYLKLFQKIIVELGSPGENSAASVSRVIEICDEAGRRRWMRSY